MRVGGNGSLKFAVVRLFGRQKPRTPLGVFWAGLFPGEVAEEGGGSYPSGRQSLAVRVGAHGQGAVEPHTSVCGRVSALQGREKGREKNFQLHLKTISLT